MRPHARPPLPPPMTRKSVSALMGAMMVAEEERCRETAASREWTTGTGFGRAKDALVRSGKDRMGTTGSRFNVGVLWRGLCMGSAAF